MEILERLRGIARSFYETPWSLLNGDDDHSYTHLMRVIYNSSWTMDEFEKLEIEKITWKKITNEDLNLDYCILFKKSMADCVFKNLEESLEYFSGDLSRVKVFGIWHDIPRQQVAYGDPGITYRFSGLTVPTLEWPPILKHLRELLSNVTGYNFDFVLVNRYRNGSDHIGEHRDDECELDPNAPIASISLGQQRTFVLKHRDARKPGPEKRNIPPVKMDLQHGSLLLMNPPTNRVWYHSIPAKKSALGIRINLTFRKYNMKFTR